VLLKGVLQGYRVHNRGQHTHLICRGRIHTATVLRTTPKITATYHNGQLHIAAFGGGNFLGEGLGGFDGNAEAFTAC
jgi:hypothetical protein